jgi:hypothetical protein
MGPAKGAIRIHNGRPFGTVPELFFEKKQLIPALQQLLVSYSTPGRKFTASKSIPSKS